MSLDWNARKVPGWHELHNTAPKGEETKFPKDSPEDIAGNREWAISETMIFRTMSVGINTITEANAEKFLARSLVVSDVFGTPLMDWDAEQEKHVDRDLTYADVHARIGLGTNASNLTDAQFRKRMIEEIERTAARAARSSKEVFEKEQAV